MGRKRPIPHESHAAVAGYFYYFGHYYAALCIDLLPAADRPFYQDHLAKILIERQEPDGSSVGLPAVQLSQAVRHGVRAAVAAGEVSEGEWRLEFNIRA